MRLLNEAIETGIFHLRSGEQKRRSQWKFRSFVSAGVIRIETGQNMERL